MRQNIRMIPLRGWKVTIQCFSMVRYGCYMGIATLK